MPRRRALPTLDRMRALTALLGEPQDSIPSVHITGTNGKGSTSAMVTTLLLAKGLTVGTYTSPNLHVVAERWLATARRSTRSRWWRSSASWRSSSRSSRSGRHDSSCSRPRPFVVRHRAGGRHGRRGRARRHLGLTNVVRGNVAVLTNVSFDHTDVLGPTLEGIAADKAGIIEPGSRVVVGEMAPELVDIVRERAEEVGAASVWVAGQDFGSESNRVAVGGRLVTLWTPGRPL